jgi:hypothetical protein
VRTLFQVDCLSILFLNNVLHNSNLNPFIFVQFHSSLILASETLSSLSFDNWTSSTTGGLQFHAGEGPLLSLLSVSRPRPLHYYKYSRYSTRLGKFRRSESSAHESIVPIEPRHGTTTLQRSQLLLSSCTSYSTIWKVLALLLL